MYTNLAMTDHGVVAPKNDRENVLYEVAIPANAGKGAVIRLHCGFRYTSDANVKSLRVRYGGYLIAWRYATSSTRTQFFVDIVVTEAWQQECFVKDVTDGILTKHEKPVTTVVDTERPATITLSTQTAVVTDEAMLEFCVADLVTP